ncbi:MAG: type II toxin-antitoxin system RelE/ParE family toxin [Opitutaceae bacterium]|nr:type II toxin-antitoxin system RelE/ParE family toxin [Opitutaceae bacterium]
MVTFKLYPEAELDLEAIWQYTAKTWGDNQAIKYIDDIEVVFYLLVVNPFLCRERIELQPPVRIHHFQSHLIVYKQLGGGIGIIRILHESVDIEGHFE